MKVKLLSRLFSLLIVAIMLISCTNSVFAAAPKVDELLKLANEEGILVKAICAMPKAYDDPAKVQKLMDFYAGEIMLKQLPDYQSGKLDAATFKDSLEKLAVMRKEIKQIADPESLKIKIWPEGKMPVIVPYTSDPVGMYWDRPGFEPYIVPYLLDGNVNPKGAVIICPGGGFFVRTEPAEGDYYAKYFNSKGYQAFVLHYRVAPSSAVESSLDLQRAVRYVRYNAEKYGISPDKIVTIGSSAGGAVCINQANEMYGNIQPDKFVKGYVPDKIDKVSADVNAFIGIYTGIIPSAVITKGVTGIVNPAFPPTFLAYGNKDTGADMWFEFADLVIKSNIRTELHIFEGAPHGFGLGYDPTTGAPYEGANRWPELSAIWLDKVLK